MTSRKEGRPTSEIDALDTFEALPSYTWQFLHLASSLPARNVWIKSRPTQCADTQSAFLDLRLGTEAPWIV